MRVGIVGVMITSMALALLPANGQAQVDTELNILTTQGSIRAEANDVNISDIPRYYLNGNDILNRNTDDSSRNAPGLAKNNYIVKTYAIRNTRAIELQSYLLRMLAFEGGICEVMGLGGVDGDGPPTQFLIVAMPDFMEPGVDEFVRLADVAGFKFYDATGRDNGSGIAGATSYVGKHRTASELVAILNGTEIGNVAGFLFPLFADDSINTIYMVENPTDIADDIAALEMFDRPPLQVEMHVVVYEMEEGDDIDLGLDWDAWKRQLSGSFEHEHFRDLIADVTTVRNVSRMLSLDAVVLADFLNYLVTTNRVDIDTDAYITMVNSEDVGGLGGARGSSTADPATISSMTSIPYSLETDDGGVHTVLTAEEGVSITLLPFIGTESLTLDIETEVSSLVGYTPEGAPMISSRTSSSVVNLVDGQTIILGGLDKRTQVTTRRGIPYLKDIPYLGYLFGNTVKRDFESKVIIVLTPRIKTSADESERLAGI